jgi:hypothetical protein
VASICFVIPACNASATIPDTLRSLQRQTRPDWSAIVVDDGSADGTAAVAANFKDTRVRVVRQDNAGLAAARNRGWTDTDADAVCFLDADDTVAPAFAHLMLDALHGHDLAASAYAMVGPDLEDLAWIIRPGPHDLTPERMIRHNPLAVGAVVLRRSAPARLGITGPLFDPTLRVHEDWDCWLRLTAAGASWADPVNQPLFNYRLRPGSMSGDLHTMWRVGLDVITLAPIAHALKSAAQRHWTLRNLARCVARGDGALAAHLAEHAGGLGDVTDEDLAVLAGAIKWAFCQQEAVGPQHAAALGPTWRARVGAVLAGYDFLPALLARLDWAWEHWDRVADAAARRAGHGGVIVIYGIGRNGRALLHELARLDPPNMVAWMDNHPNASAPGFNGRTIPRLELRHLTHRHLVVVTPEDRRAIMDRLGRAGVTRVTTPRELVSAPPFPAVAGAA